MTEVLTEDRIRDILLSGEVVAVVDAIVESPEIIPNVARLLEDPNAKVRSNATDALGSAAAKGVDISAAVEGLAKLLEDPDDNIRRDATDALESASEKGVDISAAIPGLAKLLEDTDDNIRRDATDALGNVTANEKSSDIAITALVACLRSDNVKVRRDTSEALRIAAEKSYIDLALVANSLAEYVARVRETGSEADIASARKYAAESYSKIAAAASKRTQNSKEMAGEMLRPSIRPITPRDWNSGMLRMQNGKREIARLVA